MTVPGQTTITSSLPIRAGLAKLLPIPPNICLTTRILKISAAARTHKGTVTGMLKARSIPVTTALKSPAVTCFFVTFCHKNSVSTHRATEKAVR